MDRHELGIIVFALLCLAVGCVVRFLPEPRYVTTWCDGEDLVIETHEANTHTTCRELGGCRPARGNMIAI